MKILNRIIPLFILTLICSVGRSQSAKDTLVVGSNAPAVKVAAWLKGEPVDNFENGKVYLVELGTRYCHGCLLSIPHLSEIAKEFAQQAKVVSIIVDENEKGSADMGYVKMVAEFAKSMNDKIHYSLAVDDKDQFMFDHWTHAAGFRGYPYAFIVSQQGKIVWIGDPLSKNLKKYMADVISNKFNFQNSKSQQAQSDAIVNRLFAYDKSKKYVEAMSLIDSSIIANPQKMDWITEKFDFLLKYNESDAYKYARQFLKNNSEGIDVVIMPMAADIAFAAYKGEIKCPDWKLAIDLTTHAFNLEKQRSSIMCYRPLLVQAYVYAHKADFEKRREDYVKAVEIQEKASVFFNQYNYNDKDGKESIERTLNDYKSKVQK